MIGEGLYIAKTIDSKETIQRLYSHRATGFEYESVKSLDKDDTPGSMSGLRSSTSKYNSCVFHHIHTILS
jgi:hypothetical protein